MRKSEIKQISRKLRPLPRPPIVVERDAEVFWYAGQLYRMDQLQEVAETITVPPGSEKIIYVETGDPRLPPDPTKGFTFDKGGLRFVGDDPEELREIWRRMGVQEGTESWEWREQTYIIDKGLA